MPVLVSLTSGISSIGTFSELVATVERAMERDYDNEVRDYIRLTEARLNRLLRGPDMEKLTTISLALGAAVLPLDFLEAKRVSYDGRTLDYIASTELANMRASKYPDVNHFALIGGEIVVPPLVDGNVQLLYWQAIPPLGEDQPTNWMIRQHPDLYFAGAMHEACADIKDEDAVLWLEKFDGLIDELKAYLVSKQTAGPMRMKPQFQPWNARI